MKKLLLILLCLPFIGFGQNVYIPDANFKAYLVGNSLINTNGDSEIQISEANAFNGNISCSWSNIADLSGIEHFISVTKINCGANQLTSVDLSNNTNLTQIWFGNNQLTGLDVSNNIFLTEISVENNQLSSLDVTNNTSLQTLSCSQNQITSLDVSNNILLNYLYVWNNMLLSIDLSNNINLISLNCDSNQISSLNIANNILLNFLQCNYNQLIILDLSSNTNLEVLGCSYNQLVSINLSQNHLIVALFCNNNQLTSLNLSQLSCSLQINESNFSENPNLNCIEVTDLSCWNMFINYLDTTYQYYSSNCTPSAMQEHSTNKKLLKITDLLGRETKQTNQPLFYIYDNGTVEKRIVIE
ncbi:MAG: hypothetical protein CMA06_03335 [Euryarchaeota archaeon]|nr:hypothetical protein [Euryarchaeota archaeon]